MLILDDAAVPPERLHELVRVEEPAADFGSGWRVAVADCAAVRRGEGVGSTEHFPGHPEGFFVA
jgi:hypothetical protein